MSTRFWITVKPRANREMIESRIDSEYHVSVNAPAEKGKANEAVVALLAGYFSVPRSRIKIVRGNSSRRKLIEID